MTVEVRILLVGLAVFAGVGLIVAMLVLLAGRRSVRGTASERATRLANLRLLPTAAGGIAGVVVSAAFLAFEPRWDGEDLGLAVLLLGTLGALLLASAAWRGFRLIRGTRATIQGWLRNAEPVELPGVSIRAFAVDTSFPVVTVVGLRRPRLIIARSVLDSCSDEELRAILAHEQGHIDRRDNLRRLLISMAPDVLTWLPVSATLLAAWREAAEEAADDEAVRCGADGRVRLAAALVKVARLAPGSRAHSPMPASALYRGESLDRRVRRLLASSEPAASSSSRVVPVKAALGLLVAGSITMLESIHGLLEGLIHNLP